MSIFRARKGAPPAPPPTITEAQAEFVALLSAARIALDQAAGSDSATDDEMRAAYGRLKAARLALTEPRA